MHNSVSKLFCVCDRVAQLIFLDSIQEGGSVTTDKGCSLNILDAIQVGESVTIARV